MPANDARAHLCCEGICQHPDGSFRQHAIGGGRGDRDQGATVRRHQDSGQLEGRLDMKLNSASPRQATGSGMVESLTEPLIPAKRRR